MFAQESLMDIQKIKELALANGFSLKEQASGNMDLHSYVYEFANAIEQAAKAQAVPEGFVLVPKEPTDAMLFAASGRDIVAEHYGDENILWPELRETWKAMIEAQEPAND